MKSYILKIAIFATGLSGIVAEYILSTLATYFLGDSVVQWTLIISVMLFAMGLGSRLSRYLETDLVIKFITIEFLLSLFVAFSPLLAYMASAFTVYTGMIIYTLAIIIGLMIGMEIPLVIRLNSELQELKINVSSVIENDYYGSLLGGVFFVFVGLPILGITYTPFVLGLINFTVAVALVIMIREAISEKLAKITLAGSAVLLVLVAGFFAAQPIIFFGEQAKYKDKIIYEEQSKYQKIVLTEWKDNYWFYLNGNLQLSTLDEFLYHEPLVHPIMNLVKNPSNVLVLGGGDGNATREILKYQSVKKITLVDLDPAVTNLAKTNEIFLDMNKGSLLNPKVEIINTDGYNFVEETKEFYDVIIVDLPDPRSVELGRLYSHEFYVKCSKILRPHGAIITQAGSPYYASKAFLCIEKTIKSAGFSTLKMHNQVLTMGQWGWVLGSKSIPQEKLRNAALSLKFDQIELNWLNNEAMHLITSFGKDIFSLQIDSVKVNKIHNPVLYRYYLDGNWDIY
ncbi:MAG: polyamine aminopropyltransferase 2 [Melioribacteraceae bacterium]|nr:MAG: polyamine aminopropyltransferase 2 [Melioribacteraceae bacterium]